MSIIRTIYILLLSTPLWSQNNLREVVEKMIRYDTEISFDETPGFIIAVIDGDETFIESFGHALNHPDTLLKSTDRFELGGLSKVITSLVCIEILHQHHIALSDLIYIYLDDEVSNHIKAYEWTFEDLLTHHTGLPKIPEGLGLKEVDPHSPYARYTMNDLLSFLTTYKSDPKSKFQYSHINYAFLEYLIERITGKPYKNILNQYLHTHIGVYNTNVYDAAESTLGMTRSHKVIKGQTFQSFGAALGIRSTLDDMTQILRFIMSLDTSSAPEHLKPILAKKVKTGIEKKLFFTTGLYRMDIKKFFPLFIHSGRSNGHYAFMGIVPGTQTGAIILANSVIGTKDLGLLTLRMINDTWKRKPHYKYE